MMTAYANLKVTLVKEQSTWLVTGAAGFIGSNLLEVLLKLNQRVVGLDNFSTGYQRNLDEVRSLLTTEQLANFQFIQGDIRDVATCHQACKGVDYVLHQAALGSVPRSIEDPITTNQNNIDGFLNMLVAARDAKVRRFVYAASSSTYGDHEALPKIEHIIGRPISPYAVTKYVNELYADVFSRTYNLKTIGLRYFNVFGPRQNPNGAYAAVIPKWFASMARNDDIIINGDGSTSRDFCYITNVVQANILAAIAKNVSEPSLVLNVAYGERTTLTELSVLIKETLATKGIITTSAIHHTDFRTGDIRHSLADIAKARNTIGYNPEFNIKEGLSESATWYIDFI